jgi:hypothetical protein
MSAGPHLSDELLSAHLDGADAGPHLAACAECRARLDELAAAAAAIATPPALPAASVVDAAVAHALDAEERSSRRPLVVALAAAVLVVLGVMGAMVGGDEERPSESDTALSGRVADENGTTAAADSETSGVAFGGDLGELDDPRELADRVRADIEPPPTTTSMATADGGAIGGGGSAALQTSKARTNARDPYCEQAVAEELGRGLGSLVYRATLRWNGTPAVAVAYRPADAGGALDHRLFVLSVDGCEVLVAQMF